jgi:hypothetical protein
MHKFDENPAFLEWSSEETIVYYRSPLDKPGSKPRRYFIDFKVKKKCPRTGEITTYLVEVKPKGQTRPPKRGNKKTKTYVREAMTYGVNEAKWNAAIKYCEDRGYKFLILTEDSIPGT